MAKRRPSGDGTVRKRKDGRWEGRVVIGHSEKGLPRTKNVLARTKRECQAKLKELREAIAPPASESIRPVLRGVAGLLVSERLQAETPAHHPAELRGVDL